MYIKIYGNSNNKNSDDMNKRAEESVFFTPVCRRDIYKILCSTFKQSPSHISKTSTNTFSNSNYGTITNSSKKNITIFKWRFKSGPLPMGALPGQVSLTDCEFMAVEDTIEPSIIDLTTQAIDAIGQVNEGGIAVTNAFEKLLSNNFIPNWTEKDMETFSIQFIMAFNKILPSHLNLTHIIRSRQLEKSELHWLCNLLIYLKILLHHLIIYYNYIKIVHYYSGLGEFAKILLLSITSIAVGDTGSVGLVSDNSALLAISASANLAILAISASALLAISASALLAISASALLAISASALLVISASGLLVISASGLLAISASTNSALLAISASAPIPHFQLPPIQHF